jgi:hypothetical protein
MTALLLATVAVAVQLVSAAHPSELGHTRCDDHDRLIELSLDAHAPDAAPSGTRVDQAPAAGHAHDHCTLAATHTGRAACATVTTTSAPLAPTLTFTVALAPDLDPRDLLRLLAPKTSPPALA